jgi:hypothetical protein
MKAKVAAGVSASDLGKRFRDENMNLGLCRILLPVVNGSIPASHVFPASDQDESWDYATAAAYAEYVAHYLFQPAGVYGPTFRHADPDALGYSFPAGKGWNTGDGTTTAGGSGWYMSVHQLLDVMGCFRRQGTIMSTAAAQQMLDDRFGIDKDRTKCTPLGMLYNKNGETSSNGAAVQSVAYFLPRDMELVVFTNSPIGNPVQDFDILVRNIYLANIQPEVPVGGWIARYNLTAEQYQEAINDYSGNHGMQLVDVSGYGSAVPLYAALWVKTASPPVWQARHGLTSADYQAFIDRMTADGYYPVLVNGYATTAGPRFACIFQQGATGAWVARHDLTAAQYRAAFDQYSGEGYVPDWVSGYFDGSQNLYAAIWRNQPGAPAWKACNSLDAEQYQAFFDIVTTQGYKPVVVCGYSYGVEDLYAGIFRLIAGAPAWQARHRLTPTSICGPRPNSSARDIGWS